MLMQSKNRCRVCKRELKDAFYVDFGIGKKCAEKLGIVIETTKKFLKAKGVKDESKKNKSKIVAFRLRRSSKKYYDNPLQLKIPFIYTLEEEINT